MQVKEKYTTKQVLDMCIKIVQHQYELSSIENIPLPSERKGAREACYNIEASIRTLATNINKETNHNE